MIDVTVASISAQSRRRAASALAAGAVGVAALLIALQSGASAVAGVPVAPGRVAAPVTTTAGKLTLGVDPAGGLTAAGAMLKVTGSGFDTGTGIYLAICHADGKAPASLRDCVGGAVPDANLTKSWAHISDTAEPGGSGQVAAWGAGGSFAVQLTLPPSNSTSDALDCAKVACAVYTAPDKGRNTAENLSVPLVYAAPATTGSSTASTSSTVPSTSSPSSTAASSSAASSTPASAPATSAPTSSSPEFSTSSALVPTTVQAKSVRSPTIVAGALQEVLFAGFAKNEPVTVTLYSAPRSLPATRADQDGVVKVDFTVPTDLAPATHLLRVVGQTSKVTGIASFVVTAPVVASSAVVVPSTPVTTSAAPASAPASAAVPVPVSVSPESSAASTAASSATASSAVVAVGAPAESGKVVWPWYALGALLAILAGLIAYLLTRRSRLAAERRDNDAVLADAAAAERERNLDAVARANADAPTAYLGGAEPGVAPAAGGYTGYHPGEHGLLSGRDNPDSPGLLSGTGYRLLPPVASPTTVLPGQGTRPDERTTRLPDDATTQLPGDATPQPPTQPRTGQIPAGQPPRSPGVTADDDATTGGPATGTWRPDFDDDSQDTDDQR